MKNEILIISFLLVPILSSAQWDVNGNILYYNNGNVGIGLNDPTGMLHIKGSPTIGTPPNFNNAFIKASNDNDILAIDPNQVYTNNNLNLQTESGYVRIYTVNTPRFQINQNGNVGIGTTSPNYKLDINGNVRFAYGSGILVGDHTYKKLIKTGWDGIGQDYVSFHVPGNTGNGSAKIYLKSDGNVGIGNTNPSEKLVIDGKILAEEVRVENVPASDYVFKPDYELKPLEDVETFVKENKHLPDIPSAVEFKENGVGLGEMDDMLLRKVEELTLYVIELKKENEELKEENEKQNEVIQSLIDNRNEE